MNLVLFEKLLIIIIDNNYIVDYDNKELFFQKLMEIYENRDNIFVKLDNKFLIGSNIERWKTILELYQIQEKQTIAV